MLVIDPDPHPWVMGTWEGLGGSAPKDGSCAGMWSGVIIVKCHSMSTELKTMITI